MSVYQPKLEDLRVEERPEGWYVCDKHGPLEGPYESVLGLGQVMLHLAGEDER